MRKNKSSIQTEFLNKMILIVLVSIGLWCLIWIQGEYSTFKSESIALRSESIQSQKSLLQKEVAGVVRYINDMRKQAEQNLESALKERVYEAHAIAMNIYRQNAGSKKRSEIIKMVKDALRPVRFNGGRGYYFAVSMDGVEQLYPVSPEFEGENLLDLMDSKGNFVIQDEIVVVEKKSEGFVTNFWIKPEKDTSMTYPKISFVKYFKPLNWYFGAGEYLDDAKEQIQEEVLNRLVNLRFGKEGYFFGSTYEGGPLFSDGQITLGSGSIWNLTDPKGVKIIQEQKKAIQTPEGGFIYYAWNKLNTSLPSPKISFVQGLPEWEWMIGAGIYLDAIEKTILENKAALTLGLKNKIVRSLVILVVLLFLIYFWSKRISNKIEKSLESFSLSLKKATHDSILMDPGDIGLQEFKDLAEITNKMLESRKQAEAALKKNEAQFRNLFNSMTDLIYTQDMEGRFTSVNPAMKKLFGYSQDDFIGHNTKDFMKIEHRSDYKSQYLEKIKKQGYQEGIGCYLKKNKEQVYIEYKNSLVLSESGEPYISGMGRDVTEKILSERKVNALQEQIVHSQKMESIGTLAGGIAHDFNNILFPVLGHTEMLLQDYSEDSTTHGHLKKIYSGAIRARDLVKQILTFARQETHELKLIDIGPVIKEALNLIRATIPTTIEIKQETSSNCGLIKADPTQIHQVIMNLTTNAYHAMENTGGVLEVCLKETHFIEPILPDIEAGRYACLTISDTGPGMSKAVTEKIFTPFFTTKELGKGTGMGLSVVHGIVSGLGGAIQVSSKPGKGTSFHVFFPVIKSVFENKMIPSKGPVQGGTEQILLVDDENEIILMEKRMLERLGYTVSSRTSSLDALEAFRANPDKFDLVITDMAMPNMPGDKLSAELIKIRPDIPILLCTGFSESLSEENAAALGIKNFLLKPIVMKDLADKIRNILSPSSL